MARACQPVASRFLGNVPRGWLKTKKTVTKGVFLQGNPLPLIAMTKVTVPPGVSRHCFKRGPAQRDPRQEEVSRITREFLGIDPRGRPVSQARVVCDDISRDAGLVEATMRRMGQWKELVPRGPPIDLHPLPCLKRSGRSGGTTCRGRIEQDGRRPKCGRTALGISENLRQREICERILKSEGGGFLDSAKIINQTRQIEK